MLGLKARVREDYLATVYRRVGVAEKVKVRVLVTRYRDLPVGELERGQTTF